MNSYKLDDKDMDNDFLSGKTVVCKAAIPDSQLSTLNEGEPIVVVLSNGKKYRGIVGKFDHTIKNKIASGNLEILKPVK
jgi:hypothetical protein